MRRLPWLLALVAVAGCDRFLYRTPQNAFSHETHQPALAAERYDCLACHRFVSLAQRDFHTASALSELAIKPRRHACHSCHVDPDASSPEATARCPACHSDMLALRPETHQADWTRGHAPDARLDRQACAECHSEWYCSDCHTRRQTIQPVMHSRPFTFYHSVEAQVDPASCTTCHESGFCKECHGR